MRNLRFLSEVFLLISFFLFLSCKNNSQNSGNYSEDLSAESKTTITNEILDLTDNWATNLNDMDFDKAIEIYDSSSDLKYAENGVFFANIDSLDAYLKSYKSTSELMNIVWNRRVVVPLSLNAASLAGDFNFKIVLKTGEIFQGVSMITALFVRKNNKWVLMHGHESFK